MLCKVKLNTQRSGASWCVLPNMWFICLNSFIFIQRTICSHIILFVCWTSPGRPCSKSHHCLMCLWWQPLVYLAPSLLTFQSLVKTTFFKCAPMCLWYWSDVRHTRCGFYMTASCFHFFIALLFGKWPLSSHPRAAYFKGRLCHETCWLYQDFWIEARQRISSTLYAIIGLPMPGCLCLQKWFYELPLLNTKLSLSVFSCIWVPFILFL